MKFIDQVSPEKLRGGFYTPARLVRACYDRIESLADKDRELSILEPAAGDGAFVRYAGTGRPADAKFTCVELIPEEAEKCRQELKTGRFQGRVINDSFFAWAVKQPPEFSALVGNPPFVRYQFLRKDERQRLNRIMASGGKSLAGVANLWIPFTLLSLELLREQGAFALILPSELLAIKSAGLLRSELIRHADRLQIDLYPRGAFEGILQDVVLVSGRRDVTTATSRPVLFCEHGRSGIRKWTHSIDDSKQGWTRFLLTTRELAAFAAARELPEVHRLGDLATLGVSIVTGANDFFTVDDRTVDEFALSRWARPLLGRTAECRGIVYRRADQRRACAAGKKVWILDFSAQLPDPNEFVRPRAYLRQGQRAGLPGRYKCRIREPWYRVPAIRSGRLMLSKRAHQSHRLILNDARVHTTDTIYRGEMKRPFGKWRRALVAGFHNSLTILSSETEGRTYGGGVLEMVPSEIARLLVPLVDMQPSLATLDATCRSAGGQLDATDTLVHATDQLLCRLAPGYASLLPDLIAARLKLRQRRLVGGEDSGAE